MSIRILNGKIKRKKIKNRHILEKEQEWVKEKLPQVTGMKIIKIRKERE